MAKARAAKMTAAKYSVNGSAFKALRGKQFTIINRETGARYTVSIDPEKTFCNCAFFRSNQEFGICKHTLYAQEQADWEASVVAREEMYAL